MEVVSVQIWHSGSLGRDLPKNPTKLMDDRYPDLALFV
jgi:hypothetical protein